MKAFAANIRRHRTARGLTQEQLADELGLSRQTVFYYESGSRWPQAAVFDQLAVALKVEPWQLLASEGQGGAIPPEVIDQVAALARACGLNIPR